MSAEIHDLIYDYVRSLEHLKYLSAKQTAKVKEFRNLQESWNEERQILQEVKDDFTLKSCIETRTIYNWNAARLEQTEIKYNIQRDELTNRLTAIIENFENEADITTDIEGYLDNKIKEVDAAVEMWITRCDTEIEAMDEDIQIATEQNKVLEVVAKDTMDEYNSRQKEMDDYWEEKRLAAEAILLLQKKIKYAIRIQAWWRGVMVRKHLGPFRRHRRRGKGKGGKSRKGAGVKKGKGGKKN